MFLSASNHILQFLVCPLCSQQKAADKSRRRKFREAKDVDFINDRNAHFNRKIDRAFSSYTNEIRANLERGTALPER